MPVDSYRLVWILGFSLLGSAGAIGLAGLMLMLSERTQKRLIPFLISFATGTLLGAAFLGLMPRALRRMPTHYGLLTVLLGIVLFIVLEQGISWHHSHGPDPDHQHEEDHSDHGNGPGDHSGAMILIGDAFHKFVDGVIIATAFLDSISLGIATSLSVISHEIPHEVGDFAILLRDGYDTRKALLYNMISGLTALLGAVLLYVFLAGTESLLPYVMCVSASSFIYIAIADLVPDLRREAAPWMFAPKLVCMLSGIGLILLFHLS